MGYDFTKLKSRVNLRLKKDLLGDILEWDNSFYLNYDRTKFLVTKKRKRSAISEYGIIIYNRRIYKDKRTGECICFTDLYFGINKKSRIMDSLRKAIFDYISTSKTISDIKSTIPNAPISLVSIGRILSTTQIPKTEILEKITLGDKQILYINTDDCYQYLRVNGRRMKHRVRVVTFNTGLVSKGGYNRLMNKRYAYLIVPKGKMIDNYTFVNFVKEKIIDYYAVDNPKLVMGGDGEYWIKAAAKLLNAEYIADCYHGIKFLWDGLIGNKVNKSNIHYQKYIEAKNYFKGGEYEKLIKILLLQNVDKNIIHYFQGCKQGIINQSAIWNIGVSAESDIFHLVKAMCSGARLYSDKHFKNKLFFRTHILNQKNFHIRLDNDF